MTDKGNPRVELVPVFHITNGAVVPLARIALEQAGIEYELRAQTRLIPGIREGAGADHTGFDASVPGDVFVRADDAARARGLLADLGRGD